MKKIKKSNRFTKSTNIKDTKFVENIEYEQMNMDKTMCRKDVQSFIDTDKKYFILKHLVNDIARYDTVSELKTGVFGFTARFKGYRNIKSTVRYKNTLSLEIFGNEIRDLTCEEFFESIP